MPDYHQWKESGKKWTSPPFYTHPKGCKMHLEIITCISGCGNGAHDMSVSAHLVKGEHDDQLQWSFEGDLIIELLNWREDQGHHRKTVTMTGEIPVGEGEFGISQDFISHCSLSYDPTTNTEYLHDDCLRLRAKTVAIYSTPLLLKTPAWQDPLTASQSLCEFTVTEFSKRKQFNNRYFSPPFYTHPRGYKMCLYVDANGGVDAYGNSTGKGTHVSVLACLMKGEHDEQLQWPFNRDIVIDLLNWRENKGHHKESISFNRFSEFSARPFIKKLIWLWEIAPAQLKEILGLGWAGFSSSLTPPYPMTPPPTPSTSMMTACD